MRGLLEGFAAWLIAEHGLSRQLSRDLQKCLAQGDKAVNKETMDLDDCAAYVEITAASTSC